MKTFMYQKHIAWALVLLLSAGLVSLHAAPGGNKGGNGKGSSADGEHGKGSQGTKAWKASQSIESKLVRNRNLSSRLSALLPEGADLLASAAGFKNLGQFVAAVHVSHNLGIPFDVLKAEMVDNGRSLGQAIHVLRPEVDAEEEAEEAESEAESEVNPA